MDQTEHERIRLLFIEMSKRMGEIRTSNLLHLPTHKMPYSDRCERIQNAIREKLGIDILTFGNRCWRWAKDGEEFSGSNQCFVWAYGIGPMLPLTSHTSILDFTAPVLVPVDKLWHEL